MLPLNDRVEAMTRAVLAAAMHHDLWSLHIRDTTWEATETYRDRQPDLWSINSLAHRYAYYVRIATCFVQGPKVNSIPRLLRDARAAMSPDASARAEGLLAEAIPLAKKAELLRNRIYAHQSASQTVADVYADAQANLDGHARLVCLALDLLNEVRSAVGLAEVEVSRSHIDQFIWVIEAIDARAAAET